MTCEECLKNISKCLFWHDYGKGKGNVPICVNDPDELKKLLTVIQRFRRTIQELENKEEVGGVGE